MDLLGLMIESWCLFHSWEFSPGPSYSILICSLNNINQGCQTCRMPQTGSELWSLLRARTGLGKAVGKAGPVAGLKGMAVAG